MIGSELSATREKHASREASGEGAGDGSHDGELVHDDDLVADRLLGGGSAQDLPGPSSGGLDGR